MANKADLRRRWLGGIFLGVAALMLVMGETALREQLRTHPWFLLIYWSLCFLCVMAAVFIAVLDLAVLRRRLRVEQRDLLEKTLEQVAEEKKNRSGISTNGNHRK